MCGVVGDGYCARREITTINRTTRNRLEARDRRGAIQHQKIYLVHSKSFLQTGAQIGALIQGGDFPEQHRKIQITPLPDLTTLGRTENPGRNHAREIFNKLRHGFPINPC